jgi:hypothetical protein
MHGCIDKMDSFGIDSFREAFYAPMRKIGIDGQITMQAEFLAQIDKSRINGRSASTDVQQLCFPSGIEPFRPLSIRAIRR